MYRIVPAAYMAQMFGVETQIDKYEIDTAIWKDERFVGKQDVISSVMNTLMDGKIPRFFHIYIGRIFYKDGTVIDVNYHEWLDEMVQLQNEVELQPEP